MLCSTGASETLGGWKQPKTNANHKEAETMLRIPTFIFAGPHQQTPFFPTDTFHSRVCFTYIWFYCSRWQAHLGLLWAMVKREGEKIKKVLTKWAVASHRLCFSEPRSIAELFHHRTCPRSRSSSWIQQLLLLTHRVNSQLVVHHLLLLMQQNNTHLPLPPAPPPCLR